MSEVDRAQLASYLRSVPVFSDLSDADLHALAGAFRPRSVGAGQFVFRAGDAGKAMYVVASGEVELLDSEGNVFSVLRPGAFVGEQNVLAETPYEVSARASKETSLWVLDRQGLEAVMMERPKVGLAVTKALVRRTHARPAQPSPATLGNTPLFKGLTVEALAEIASMLRVVSYAANAVVYRRGDPAQAVYIVADGEVSVREGDEEAPELYRARPFDCLGLAEALAGEPHAHAAVAVKPSVCWMLPAAALETLVERFPQVGVNVNRLVAAELVTEERVLHAARPEFQAPVPVAKPAAERPARFAWWQQLHPGLRWRLAVLAVLLVWLAVAISWTITTSARQSQMYASIDPAAWGKTIVGNSPAGVSVADEVQLAYPTPTATPIPTPTPLP